MRKKALSLVLASVIALGAAGCAGNAAPSSTTAPAPAAPTQAPVAAATAAPAAATQAAAPAEPERVKETSFSILYAKAAHEVPADKMDVIIKLEEISGIKIKWDNPDEQGFTERYNLLMASGDLPDSIVNMPKDDILKYGQMGAIIPLEDIVAQNMPNLSVWLKEKPILGKSMTFNDGHQYFLPFFDALPAGNNPTAIRKDWLDALGLQSPETTDEWYEVLKAFKESDVNGSGKNDVIPFSSGSFKGNLRPLVSAWGVLDGFYSDPEDGGKVHYGQIEDRYKEALQWMAKLYAEGLIDKEIITNDGTAFQSKVAQNLVGSFRGSLGGNLGTFNTTLPESIPGLRYESTPPIKGPYGHQIHVSIDGEIRNGGCTVITTACKDPITLAEWYDYIYSPEGSLLFNMGIEGKHYTMVNGEPTYTDFVNKNPDGLSKKQVVGTYSPAQSSFAMVYQHQNGKNFSQEHETVRDAKLVNIIPYLAYDYVLPSFLAYSSEDDALRRDITANLDTYVDETLIKFFTGSLNFDKDWDNFVAEVKKMNIDKLIEINQKALDEFNSR